MVSAIGWLFGKMASPAVPGTDHTIILEGSAATVTLETLVDGVWVTDSTLQSPGETQCELGAGLDGVRLSAKLAAHEQIKYSLKKTS